MTKDKLKHVLSQTALSFFSISALLLAYHPDPEIKKLSPLFGLAGQPFWMYTAIKNKLWGIVVSNCAFICAFIYGVYVLWLI